MKNRTFTICCTIVLGFVLSQPTYAIRHKRWTPAVVNTAIHDGLPSPQLAHGTGTLLFANKYTGVTTQAEGVTLNSALPVAGFYKKVEVQVLINKGVTYSDKFGWYQQFQQTIASNLPQFTRDTGSNWTWDTGFYPYPPGPYAGSHSNYVDSSRIIYLWDAPGVPTGLETSAAPVYYANNQSSFRDSVKWISPSNDSKDIIPGYWMSSWSQTQTLHKDAGATVWYATENQ